MRRAEKSQISQLTTQILAKCYTHSQLGEVTQVGKIKVVAMTYSYQLGTGGCAQKAEPVEVFISKEGSKLQTKIFNN